MRRAQVDSRTRQIRNLCQFPNFTSSVSNVQVRRNYCTNPSFEATSGTVNVRTNLATNPSFEASTTTVNVRTNLAANPRATSLTSWASNGGNGTAAMTNQTTGGPASPSIPTFNRLTWSVANTSPSGYVGFNVASLSAGAVYSGSMYARASKAQTVVCQIDWYNGATYISTSSSANIPLTANTWTQISLGNVTAPANTTNAYIYVNTSAPAGVNWAVGDTLDATGVMFEQTTVLGAYFDGTTAASGDFTYAWSGTANASTSYQRGVGVNGTIYNNGVVGAYQSTVWADTAAGGTKSMRLTPTLASNASYATPEGDAGGGMKMGMAAGNTYTVSATCHIEAAQTGTLHPNARQIVFFYKDSGGNYQTASSAQMPNVANTTQRLSVTVTIPAGATEAFVRLYNGASQGNGDVWWDNELVEASTILLPYFDGSTAASGDYNYAWSTTPNASISYQRATGVTNVGQGNSGQLGWAYSSTLPAAVSSGTKALRITPGTQGSTDSFADISSLFAGFTFQPNSTYTVSVDRYLAAPLVNPSAGFQGFRFNITTDMAFTYIQPVLNVAGKTRIVATFTTGATATLNFLRLYNGASQGNGDVWYDNLVLEDGVTDGSYFDGAKAASGDFTYNWTGTANASASQQMAPTPNGWSSRWFGNSGGSGVTWQSQQSPLNGPFMRKWWKTANTGPALDVGINNSPRIPVTPGRPYTVSLYFRSSVAQHVSIFANWFDAGGTLVGSVAATDLGTLIPNVWARYSRTMTPPAGAVVGEFLFGPYTNAIAMPAGSTLDWDLCQVELSPTLSDYVDGSMTFAKWDGAANVSTSVGYSRAQA